MRTTYVYKQNQNEGVKQNVEQPKQKVSSVSLVDTYLLVKAIATNINEEMVGNIESKIWENAQQEEFMAKASQPRKEQELEPVKEEIKEEKPKKKKWKLVVGLCVALFFIGAFGSGYYLHSVTTVEDLQASVDRLYTSEEKTDIKDGFTQKDIDSYYQEASALRKRGKDVSSISDELTTISYFIQDKNKLAEYNDSSYDLTTMGLSNDLKDIENNTKNYTVSGLAVTITNSIAKVTTQYDTYINLKLEMQSISDIITFDESVYASKIDQIKHEPNKEELQGIYDILVADKKAAEAQAQVDAAQNEEELANAQQALLDAQAVQQEMQAKLEKLQESLQSTINYKSTETSEPQDNSISGELSDVESTETEESNP